MPPQAWSSWLLLLLTTTSDLRETEVIHKVVFFGMLVVVPLGLSLVPASEQPGSSLYRLTVLVQPIAALPAIASFYFETGPLAALLSSAWFILSGLIALFGLMRFKSRGLYPVEESVIDAGLVYLIVAGVWLIVYRLGIQPFDYGETIILLTVIHFHFAGFAAPIIAGMSGTRSRYSQTPTSCFQICGICDRGFNATGRGRNHFFTVARFDWNGVARSGSGDACGAYDRMGNPRNRTSKQPLAFVYRSTLDLLRNGPRLSLRLQPSHEDLNHRHPHHGSDTRPPERLRFCGL